MQIKELIKSIAAQSGVPADNPALKSIIDNATLSLEVDEDLSKLLTAPRLTMEAAKANPDLKKHFKKEVFDGISAEVKRTATELELDEESISEIDAQDSDFKRIGVLAKKVQALTAKKAGATPKDIEKLNQKITELNGQAASIRTEYEGKLKVANDGFEAERVNWNLDSILGGFDYATGVDKDINITVGRTLINKSLAEKGLKIVKKDNALTLQTSEGTEYFDETNKVVPLKDFVTKSLANAKVLKASSGTQTPASGSQQQQHRRAPASNEDRGDGLNAGKLLDLSAEN